ncbi:MAG TPA: hypothetical protein VEP90_13720 [Methylomirabilota bacterium]|nr:hypothetical protein [Methylomirabilota bacterium]
MAVISVTNTALTSATSKVQKVRYFSIEVVATSMKPLTQYNMFVDGVLMNAFCKPFGLPLGAPMVADSTGKLIVQYHMSIPYNQTYLTAKVDKGIGYILKTKQIQFVDPNGTTATTYIPVRIKSLA